MKKLILSLVLSAFVFASFGQKFLDNAPPLGLTVERINQAMAGAFVASGTDTYTVTYTNGSYSYTALTNLGISVKFTNPNTGASTINFDGLGAKNVLKWSSGSLVAVSANDLIGTVKVRYDGTQFVMEGGTGSGGAGTPAGSDGDIQINSGGAFGTASLTTNGSNLNVDGTIIDNNELTFAGSSSVYGSTITYDGSTTTLRGGTLTHINAPSELRVTTPIGSTGTSGKFLGSNGSGAVEWLTPPSGGDASTNTATSVDSEIALFSSTTGKLLKRATGSGWAKLTSGVLSTFSPGTGVETWVITPSWTNFISAITGTAPFYSTASGGTATGVNTFTSNARVQLNHTGTWTATTTGDYHEAFGGTFTAMGGANTLIGYKFNPTLIASGTNGVQVSVDIGGSFSGGTTPQNYDLRVAGKTVMGTTSISNYVGTLAVAATSNKSAMFGNIEFTTSGGPSYSGVGFQSAGAGNRTLEIYGANLANSSDFSSIKFSVVSMGTARAGADLSLWNIPHPTYTTATFTATTLAMLRLDGNWPALTTPLTTQIGLDIIPSNAGNGATNLAIRTGTLAGSVLINGTTITASTLFDQRGLGTTSSTINHRWANSSNTVLASITDDGASYLLGKPSYDATITAGGTTGNRTINKPSGTVNIAAAGTTVTVTNSWCTTSSIVHAVIRTNDATAYIKNVVPGSGSFVINLGAAATAEVSIGFFVTN